jgi:hypothetical protein
MSIYVGVLQQFAQKTSKLSLCVCLLRMRLNLLLCQNVLEIWPEQNKLLSPLPPIGYSALSCKGFSSASCGECSLICSNAKHTFCNILVPLIKQVRLVLLLPSDLSRCVRWKRVLKQFTVFMQNCCLRWKRDLNKFSLKNLLASCRAAAFCKAFAILDDVPLR